MRGDTATLDGTRRTTSQSLVDGTPVWLRAGGQDRWAAASAPRIVAPASSGVGLVLARAPRTDEAAVGHLITAANLRLHLSTAPTPGELDELGQRLGVPVDVLRPRAGTVELRDGDRTLLSTPVDALGEAHLTGTVGADGARAVVADLLGGEALEVHTSLEVMDAPVSVTLTVSGIWNDLYDYLGGTGAEVVAAVFRRAVGDLVASGRIAVAATPSRPGPQLASAASDELWAHRSILGRDTETGLVLDTAPGPDDTFSLRTVRVTGEEVVLTDVRMLTALFGPSTARSLDDLVDLLVVGPDGPMAVPPHRSATRTRELRHRPVSLGSGNAVAPTAVLAASPVHELVVNRPLGSVAIEPVARPTPGPLVDDPGAASWPDAHETGERWKPPTLRLRVDDDTPLFELHDEGLTGEGTAALRAVITVPFALDPAEGAHTTDSDGLTAHLVVPFRDASRNNAAATHRMPGSVEATDAGPVARFDALNQWSRLVYHALSDPDAEPAELVVGHSFSGYQSATSVDPPTLGFGAKIAAASLLPGTLVYDVQSRTVPFKGASLVLDPTRTGTIRPGLLAGSFQVATATKPVLSPRRFRRSMGVVVSHPCAEHPDAYLERRDDATAVIGCRPALQLGAIDYVHHIEVRDLAGPSYRVFRSQIEGSSYLVVPHAYQLGRRAGEGPGRPHRPLVVLHAAVGTDADDVSVLFEAGLQPAIRPLELARLRRALTARDDQARLLWPTEISGVRADFGWAAVGALGSGLETTAMPDGTIRFGAAVDVPNWLVLRSVLSGGGIQGTATFSFQDGSSVSSAMSVDLRRIAGPWGVGPLDIARRDGHVSITNRSEAPQEVRQLVALGPGEQVDGVAVGRTIEVQATIDVPWSPPADADLYADHEPSSSTPASVEEIRSFVEEVETTLVFVNRLPEGTEATVATRLRGSEHVDRLTLDDTTPAAEATLVLPLTEVVAGPEVEYRISVGDIAGQWRTQALSDSAIVLVTGATGR